MRIAKSARDRMNVGRDFGAVVRIAKMEVDWGSCWSMIVWCAGRPAVGLVVDGFGGVREMERSYILPWLQVGI